jgi:hypothetical protein
MRVMSILYALFCIGVILLFSMAASRSYSPFADAGPRMAGFYGGGARGPTHK